MRYIIAIISACRDCGLQHNAEMVLVHSERGRITITLIRTRGPQPLTSVDQIRRAIVMNERYKSAGKHHKNLIMELKMAVVIGLSLINRYNEQTHQDGNVDA